jgi:hypothetical protein
LDGVPLAWHHGGTTSLFGSGKSLEFSVPLTPGTHWLRILQERHTLESKKKNRWAHEARVYPRAVELDLRDSSDYRLVLEVNENAAVWSKRSGPVSFTLTRNDVTLSEVEADGPDTDDWPALCEEVESGLPADKRVTRSSRRALAGCVRWSTLWPSTADVADRAAVREALAGQDYQPLPARFANEP